MVFSKSFGYAVRGIVYLSLHQGAKSYIQSEEIALQLGIPKHFLSKVLKSLSKSGILNSNKGPSGGFALNAETLNTPLIKLVNVTKGLPDFTVCALHLKKCNAANPCPMHSKVQLLRQQMIETLVNTKVSDFMKQDKYSLLSSISTMEETAQLPVAS